MHTKKGRIFKMAIRMLRTKEDDVLFKTLESKKVLPLDMVELGLIKSNKNGYHDLFRNRIITFRYWYIFIIGTLISIMIVVCSIAMIGLYGYAFYKGIIKKGKNR